MDSKAQAPRAGALALDVKAPGWWSTLGTVTTYPIDVDQLDMVSDEKCVLGQLYGDYMAGSDDLGLIGVYDTARLGFMAIYGPHLPRMDVAATQALNAHWLGEIEMRRAGQVPEIEWSRTRYVPALGGWSAVADEPQAAPAGWVHIVA